MHQKRGDDTNATIQQGNLEKLVLAAMAVYDEDDDPDIRETEPLDDEERRRRSAEVLARISALPWVAQGEWLRILGPIAGSPTEERLLEWTRESQSKASMIRFELGRIMHELRHSLRSGSSWKEDLVAARDLARQEPILLMRTKALARIGKRLGARGHKEESADVLLEALEGGRLLSQDLPPRSAGLFAPRRWGSLYVAAIEALIERGEDGRVVAELAEEVRNLGWRRYLQTSDEPRDHSCAIYEVMSGHRNVYYRYSSEKLGSGYQCLCSRQDFLAAMTQLDAWVSNRTTPISSILETISKLLIPECVRVLAEDSRVLFVPYGMARNVPWLALPVSESRPVARMWRAGVMPSLGAAAQRGVEGPTLGMGRAFLRVLWPHEQEMFPLSDELGVHGFRRGSAAPVVWDGAHLARSCVLGSLLEHEIVCIMAHGSNASKDPLGLPKMLLSVLDPNPRTILSPLDLFRVSIPRTGVFWASCHGGRAAAPEILNPLALPLAFSDALIACGAAWVISGLWQLSVGLAMDLAARLMNAPNDGVYAAIQSVFPESVKDAKAMARVAPLTFNGVPPQG